MKEEVCGTVCSVLMGEGRGCLEIEGGRDSFVTRKVISKTSTLYVRTS